MHKVRNFFINVTRLNLVKSVSSEFSPQIRCICAKTSKSNVILNKSTFVAKTTGMLNCIVGQPVSDILSNIYHIVHIDQACPKKKL